MLLRNLILQSHVKKYRHTTLNCLYTCILQCKTKRVFDNACFMHGALHFEQVNEAFSVGLTPDKDKRLLAI